MDGFPVLIIATLLTPFTILMTSGIFRITYLLDTFEMSIDHTAMNLADKLQDSLNDKTDKVKSSI